MNCVTIKLCYEFINENGESKWKIQIFEDKKIRTAWDEATEEWYFAVSDVVEILTDSKDVKQYIKKMCSRDAELNSKWGTICTPVERVALIDSELAID